MLSKETWKGFAETFKDAFDGRRVKKEVQADDDDDKKKSESAIEMQDRGIDAPPAKGSDPFAQLEEVEENEEIKKKKRQLRKVTSLIHYDLKLAARGEVLKHSTVVEKSNDDEKLYGRALFCFGPENKFRILMHNIDRSVYFVNAILVLIVISTITLALESPLDNPEGDKLKILKYIDYFMTIAFTIEASIKIIAKGFLFSGKKSYFRELWNILDFIIVVAALLGIFAGDAIDISFLKALRILKILRPLRMIGKVDGLKVAIVTLGGSIPAIVRLQSIVLFFVFLFAVLQTTLLSGRFYSCETGHLNMLMKQKIQNIETMWDCYNYGGEWVQPDLNFDNTFNSLLTLVTI